MTDRSTPLTAINVGQITDTATHGLSEQQNQIPTITFEHNDRDSGVEEVSENAATNDGHGCALSTSVDHGATPNPQGDTRQHERKINKLTLERDKLERGSNLSRRQLETMRRDNDALKRQVRDMCLRLSEGDSHLKQQVTTLEAEKRKLESELTEAYKRGQMDGLRTQLAQSERVILIQQVEAYKNEATKLKQEALGKGSDVLNTCWQASVDEAVRRKREGDSMVISALQAELAALKAEKRK
jgi:predicted RNase H-like nuclease (RuvC/YqgF family)